MKKLSWKRNIAAITLSAVVTLVASAQTAKTLVNFSGSNGATPVYPGLVQGLDGNLYGTSLGGGKNNSGTVFKMASAGTLTTLYSFCSLSNCADGALPQGALILAKDGNFYGTTQQGGAFGYGTVFKITPRGILTTLYSFDFTDGDAPFGDLVQASNGDFYGTSNLGGAYGDGTIFKINSVGILTTLHTFNGADGAFPLGALIQGPDGYLYGTTELGGYGSIFRITLEGVFTTVHSFNSTDGSYPASGLIEGADSRLYGTTYQGGANTTCNNGCGTVFQISGSGILTTLYNFDSIHGANPIAALVQGTDGNLYGTTYGGGANGWGTIFKITPAGTLTTLFSFDLTDGAQPYGSLTQATSGYFYGTTPYGGTSGDGVVFGFSVGLGPFVETLPSFGKAGGVIAILGTNLMGTTSVTFNGSPARFQVVSNSEISAAIPSGATTGTVEVITPSGTLKSNSVFSVR